MSLRTARRNARLSTNYGLPSIIDERLMHRAKEGIAFSPQQTSALAQRELEKLLSNGERLLDEQRQREEEQDGDQAKDHDRDVP